MSGNMVQRYLRFADKIASARASVTGENEKKLIVKLW